MIRAICAGVQVLCIVTPFLSCAHRVDRHDAAITFSSADLRAFVDSLGESPFVEYLLGLRSGSFEHIVDQRDAPGPFVSADLRALVDSLGEEQAVDYLLELRLRDCVRDYQTWYSDWSLEPSLMVCGARYPVTFVSYELKALYWAYLVYNKKLCRDQDLGVIIDARYGRRMFDLVVPAVDEPKSSDRYSLVSVTVCPIRNDVSKWDPAIDAWRNDWLAEMRTVGLDSLRRAGKSPLHPAYMFLAYTRPTYLPAPSSGRMDSKSERIDLELECSEPSRR